MMTLLFCDFTDAIDKIECLAKIREAEGAGDVVILHHFPLRNLFVKGRDRSSFERFNASSAGDASFVGQFRHK